MSQSLITDAEAHRLLSFLADLQHGPCGSVDCADYERFVRDKATELLKMIANRKLQSAGAYGRTIDRWWQGFYTHGHNPDAQDTAMMFVSDIRDTIAIQSRRG